MLLTEIVDFDRVRKVQSDIDPHKFPENLFIKGLKFLGSGASAQVFQGKNPHTVIHVSYHDDPNDGYIQYLKTIEKNRHNPFFPRVFKAKIYEAPAKYDPVGERDYEEGGGQSNQPPSDKHYMMIAEMEKLLPLDHPKIKDASEGLLQTQLGLKNADHLDNINFSAHSSKITVSMFLNKSNNEQFNAAVKTLEPLWNEFGVDVHQGNFMVRLTGHGPQLVIADPVHPSRIIYGPGTGY